MRRVAVVLTALIVLTACGSSAAQNKPHNQHAVVQMGSVPDIGIIEPGKLGDQHVYEFTIPGDGKTCVDIWDDDQGTVGLSCSYPPSTNTTPAAPAPASNGGGLIQVYP